MGWEGCSLRVLLRMISLQIKTSHRKRFPPFLPPCVSLSKAWVCDRQQGTFEDPCGWQSWKDEIMSLRYGVKSQILPMWSCSIAIFHFFLIEIIHILCGLIHFMSDFPVACIMTDSSRIASWLLFLRNVTPVTAYPWNILSFITRPFIVREPGVSKEVLHHPLLNHYASHCLESSLYRGCCCRCMRERDFKASCRYCALYFWKSFCVCFYWTFIN